CTSQHQALTSLPTRRSSDLHHPSLNLRRQIERLLRVAKPLLPLAMITGGRLKEIGRRLIHSWRQWTKIVNRGDFDHPLLHCPDRSEEHTSELQSRENLVCRL